MKTVYSFLVGRMVQLIPRSTANAQTFTRNPSFTVYRNLNDVTVVLAQPPNPSLEAVTITAKLLATTATIPTENKAE
jgi:hypothetical protein